MLNKISNFPTVKIILQNSFKTFQELHIKFSHNILCCVKTDGSGYRQLASNPVIYILLCLFATLVESFTSMGCMHANGTHKWFRRITTAKLISEPYFSISCAVFLTWWKVDENELHLIKYFPKPVCDWGSAPDPARELKPPIDSLLQIVSHRWRLDPTRVDTWLLPHMRKSEV